jgi:hypothetical protein
MTGLAIPDAATVTVESAARWAAMVGAWADSTDDLDALQDRRAAVQAFENYMRRRNEAVSAEIGKAARKLDLRVAALLPPASETNGRRLDLSPAGERSPAAEIPRQDRYRLRKMHAHRNEPAVAEAIERGASRNEVLRATEAAKAEAFAAEARADAKRINERFAHRVGDPAENRDASRQRGEFRRLCNDLAELPVGAAFIERHRRYLTEDYIHIARRAHAWLGETIAAWEAKS